MHVLKDRCLISISEGRIVMHDLIQQMGHEIVRKQCVNDPGKRSRLWKPEEIYQVLKKNKGTDAIQCIFLELCMIEKIQLHAKTFRKMDNLRMMQFYNPHGCSKGSNVVLPAFFNSLPDDLKFLRWDDFPKKSLPLDFCPKNLVKLHMPGSHLELLWQQDKELPNLKTLDLRGSLNLIQIPDLAQCPNIEEVILSHCPKLGEVYSSSFLCKLKSLWFDGCVSIRSIHIPSSILQRTSGLIVLNGCHNLEMFSVSNAKMGVQLHGCSTSMFRNIVPVAKQSGKRLRSFSSKCSLEDSFGRHLKQNKASVTLDPLDYVELNKEPKDNIQLLNLTLLREGSPSSFPSLNELCWLDLSNCESLSSLPICLFKLKFLRRLYLSCCLNLEKFPEIEEAMESLEVLILNETAIKELPSSLNRLVNLEELSLYNCQKLETIPFSIGSLCKLNKLNLTCCESLETFPVTIFKLKLTKLDLHGCSMLKTFPEILEPAETFVHINLTKTAIKELPSSLDYLVGLQTLCLKLCTELVSLPNSIVNLNHLSELDCSGCCSIVNLPECIAHLSSLKSLNLSDCKRLECIPQLPPSLNKLLAYDCPFVGRMIPNSRLELPSNPKEGIFEFHFTNSQELDGSAHSNIGAEAWLRITEVVYRDVFFCFPGSAVPRWFSYRSEGCSVSVNNDSKKWCSDNILIGFALCVALGCVDMDDTITSSCSFRYTLTFEYDGCTHILDNNKNIHNSFYWKGRDRLFVQDHTLIWTYHLDFATIDNRLFDAHNFTFEISKHHLSYSKSSVMVKECGICPLFENLILK
ncbi:disease resistance protein (TIR-NBS-LRR class) [Trifolium pratense]|uniref:Disease resistance protein (TIR-NBS-LRR class) n=1 Tax=Trifolium pratense TaxID=57577 RepID=A0A2K3NAM3_TRIPR|nr:disease resistance protein (TIR-NBS-LRR class) [Trifolium pratense]